MLNLKKIIPLLLLLAILTSCGTTLPQETNAPEPPMESTSIPSESNPTSNEETSVPIEHIPGDPVTENFVDSSCSLAGSYDEVVYCTECSVELSRKNRVVTKKKHSKGECANCGLIPSIPDKYVDATNGYITSETTTITTEHLIFEIDPNVYVMNNFQEIVNLITNTMQQVSGMNFAGISPYCSHTGTDTHAKVTVVKPEDSECGPAYADSLGGSVISACDIVDLYALIHENAHVLQYRQSGWWYGTMLMESISTYTTYKTTCEILRNYPELSLMVGPPSVSLGNYYCEDYSLFFEYSIEEWLDDSLGLDGWNCYIVGFHFSRYLDEVYGDYTKWIYTYEAYRPYDPNSSNVLSVEEKIKALKMAYGEDVLDGFYPWIRENEQRLQEIEISDISAADEINLYPRFMADELYDASSLKYSNLCIDLFGGIYYLSEYQGRDVSALTVSIQVDGIVDVHLYGADGNYIRTETVKQNADIHIGGAYYLILSGEYTLNDLNISGWTEK